MEKLSNEIEELEEMEQMEVNGGRAVTIQDGCGPTGLPITEISGSGKR